MMFSHHIWIDHCTFRNTFDGALDVKRGSSYVTISYNLFDGVNKVCLLGHADDLKFEAQDTGRLKVTYHHNWYKSCTQRMPLVRFGEAHVYNNYWSNVANYALGVGIKCRTYSENNHLDGGDFSDIFITDGAIKDVGSIGGSGYNADLVTWDPHAYYSYTADPATSVKSIVMANAGTGK
jgi:pectate lyase